MGALRKAGPHGRPGATATVYTEGKRLRPGMLQLGLCGHLKGLGLAIALQAQHRN
jgi:hypothetical protein